MRQFDIYENPSTRSRPYAPYLVILQSHYLDPLQTVVVAPIVRDADQRLAELDLPIEISGEALTVAMTELASIERQQLKQLISNASDQEDSIRRALERIFTGF